MYLLLVCSLIAVKVGCKKNSAQKHHWKCERKCRRCRNSLRTTYTESTTPDGPSVSTTQSTTLATALTDGPQDIVPVTVCVAVLLLLFGLILICIYKRFSHSTNRSNREAKEHKEECIYEEIQEPFPEPGSTTVANTVYATTNFPPNPSTLLHYSSIKFQSNTDRPGGARVTLDPRSVSEYSVVKKGKSLTDSTVNEACSSSGCRLYTTLSQPQKKSGKVSV